jgi:hypothetical protein
MASWLHKAAASMKRRGTEGSFGPATEANIKAGLAAGGKRAKKAAFAKAVRTIARKRKKRKAAARRGRR